MTSRILHIVLSATTLLSAVLTLVPAPSSAQPLRPEGDNLFGGKPGMHLFLPTAFLPCIREDRLLFARIRYFSDGYRHAYEQGDYERALTYTDSLIYTAERHPVRGVQFPDTYQRRAQMLRELSRDREACEAFAKAVEMKNSTKGDEQTEALREMQAKYELDRLALERALLTARHHKLMLICMLTLLTAAAAVVGFIFVGNRRTKQLQRELLLHMQHARESERKKTDFINSMCHEVRTPLNCIAGFAELLCSDETTQETFSQYCEIIQENRRQLRYLFDDMLEVAYLETVTEPLPRRLVDLSTVCHNQLRTMKVRCRKPGLTYVDSAPSENIGVNTNEKYLTLLLSALLSNAFKFTEQGEIRIDCERLGEDKVYIAVTDTGCGIAPDKQEQVFERFVKLDTFSPGNGLGLYLCRLIARHLDADIRIDSTYTAGTRVVVTLPRR